MLVSPRHGTLAGLACRRHGWHEAACAANTLSLRQGPTSSPLPIRGNVDTRLRKPRPWGVRRFIVLAGAGLRRLGLERRATEILSVDVSLPAIGQGALGIEIRNEDANTRAAPFADAPCGDRNVRRGRTRRAHRARRGLQDTDRRL